MELAIYLASKLEFFTILFCLVFVLKIGRVGMSLMIVCTVLVFKDLIEHTLIAEYSTKEVSTRAMAVVWYVMFALTNIIAITAIYVLHRVAPVRKSLVARLSVWYCSVSALLQMLMCGERLYFHTERLTPVYTYGVPTLNYLFISILIYGLYKAHKRGQEFEERIAWNI